LVVRLVPPKSVGKAELTAFPRMDLDVEPPGWEEKRWRGREGTINDTTFFANRSPPLVRKVCLLVSLSFCFLMSSFILSFNSIHPYFAFHCREEDQSQTYTQLAANYGTTMLCQSMESNNTIASYVLRLSEQIAAGGDQVTWCLDGHFQCFTNHHGNDDVTVPRDLQTTGRRRYYIGDDSDRMTSQSLALRMSEQDVLKGLQSCTQRSVTSRQPDLHGKQLLQQHLHTVTDVIGKLSHDIQVRHGTAFIAEM